MEENTKTLDIYVGNKIKERRKTLKLTQAELGDLLGVSYQQIQRYESGENTVSMVRALEIVKCLNVKLEYFYEGAPSKSPTKETGPSEIITRDNSRALKILLVEDSSSDELLFRKAVSNSEVPASVYAIQDPDQVMNYLLHPQKHGQERPDIILMDINIPRISGLTLLKKIKADPQLKVIPVVMLTNSVRNKEMLESYANHANGFIQKNADLHGFYTEIAVLLRYWGQSMILPNVTAH